MTRHQFPQPSDMGQLVVSPAGFVGEASFEFFRRGVNPDEEGLPTLSVHDVRSILGEGGEPLARIRPPHAELLVNTRSMPADATVANTSRQKRWTTRSNGSDRNPNRTRRVNREVIVEQSRTGPFRDALSDRELAGRRWPVEVDQR